jgi:hypothetical protein
MWTATEPDNAAERQVSAEWDLGGAGRQRVGPA